MVFKKIGALGSALLLALASLFVLAFSGQAQALGTTFYWCNFSSNGNFNTASFWNTASSCSGGTQQVPVAGDTLVFDNTHLNFAIGVENIPDLDFSSITFQGNGSAGYILNGTDISLDNGIADTSTASVTNAINLGINLTANQSISSSTGNDGLSLNGNINLGSNNLSLTSNSVGQISLDTFSGSGSLGLNGSGATVYVIANDDSSFSGPVTIGSDVNVKDESGNLGGLGSGAVTVNSGGSLYLADSSNTATYPNALYLDGSGDGPNTYGSVVSCLGSGGCTSANTTLTLTGKITLNGNSEVVNGAYTGSTPSSSATFDFTGGGVYNGYTLTAFPSSNTIVDPPTAIVSGSGSGSGSTGSTPKAPDTGVGLVAERSNLAVIGGLLVASTLILSSLIILRRLTKNTSSRK